MAYDQIIKKAANNSYIAEVMLRDSATGQAKTGIAYGSVAYAYWREGASTGANGTAVTMTKGTYADHGWVEVDATNQKGVYQFGVPDAALATGANAVTINFYVTGCIDARIRILLVDIDIRDAADLGLTNLDAAISTVATQTSVNTIDGIVDDILTDTGTTIPGTITTMQGNVTDILTDTGTTLDALIKDIPTVAEFEARTRVAAEYALTTTLMNLHADYAAAKTAATQASVNDIPTVAEFEARTIVSANYALEATLTTIDGLIDSILADTNELQTDWVNSGRLDALIDAIKAKTDLIPASPAAVGSAMTVSDKTGFSLSSAGIQAVWEYSTRTVSSFGTLIADTWGALTSALTGAGSIGKLLVDNVDGKISEISGGTGLTAQETRDAMKLAPSAGAAAADSIDDKIDNISVTMSEQDKTDIASDTANSVIAGLAGQTIVVRSPLISAGTIQIVKGDTYNPDRTNRRIRFEVTNASDLTGATVTFEWTGTGTATCEVTDAGQATQIIDVPLSAANTLAMQNGTFKIYATWETPVDVETIIFGMIAITGTVL